MWLDMQRAGGCGGQCEGLLASAVVREVMYIHQMAKLWGVLAKLAHLHFEHACCCLPSESLFVSSFVCLHYK